MDLILVEKKIRVLRNRFVILDSDLATLYDVTTKALNQAVKRNINRFPEEFMFELTIEEWECLRSQIVTLNGRGKFSKYVPNVFTEYGAVMLSSILRSEKAVEMNIKIVKSFINLREQSLNIKKIESKLSVLEQKYDRRFDDLEQVLDYLLSEKKQTEENETRIKIGFIK